MPGPLDGVKVIEIAQEIQGPYAGLLLADMGADVIKLEMREIGDLSRHMLAGVIAGPETPNGAFSHYFLAMNRGKRSVTIDLKTDGGRGIVERLAEQADVLITNYRPGVLDRLGLGFDALRELNPRLIYACGSSWGPEGPWKQRPSRDTLAQAAGGLMAKTGELEGQPLPCGALVADHSGGFTLANGILGALYARERTGRGQKVDVSIYGTVLALQPMEINFTSITGGIETDRAGRGHQFLKGVWGAFRTKDGYICLAGVDDARWPVFCRELGIEEIVDDPECADVVTRNYRGFKVQDALDAAFPTRTTADWMERLSRADILVAPVQGYRDILSSEQARANGYVTELEHPDMGTISVVGNPIGMSETPVGPAGPPPELGQNTEEVLLEAGYEWEDIEALRKSGAV